MIRPVKVEVLYPDPKIYVFRDILNDHEIDRLKELATPKVSTYEYLCMLGMAGCVGFSNIYSVSYRRGGGGGGDIPPQRSDLPPQESQK